MPASRTAWGDDADLTYISEIRDLCRLARCPERTIGYIERGTCVGEVLADLTEHVFGRRLPRDAARAMAPFPDLLGEWQRPAGEDEL